MHFTRTRTGMSLALACAMGTALTAQARKIDSWATVACTIANGSTPANWVIPHYDDQEDVSANITADTTWYSDTTYVLYGPIKVTAGNTLTIEAGTLIRGRPWVNTTGTSLPGTLVIEPGAMINARGTAQDPIIFTDMWDNNVPGMTAGAVDLAANRTAGVPGAQGWTLGASRNYSVWQPTFGYWGGVIIVGATPIAYNGVLNDVIVPNPAVWVEGLPANETDGAKYGNGIGGALNDDDSSGVFAYVSIRYNGFPLDASGTKEVNGLSLYSVGRGTEIHHVEALNTVDDAFEFFGGSVNTKYLFTWVYGDDAFDSDEGHRGKHQFLFAVQGAVNDVINKESGGFQRCVGSAWGDKGMEIDGANGKASNVDDASLPLALSQWYNITIIGKGPMASGEGTGEGNGQWAANTAILCRDNAGPQIYNSIFMDFRGAGVTLEARGDKNDLQSPAYNYSTLTRAKTAYNSYPVNSSVDFPNSALYGTQTPGFQLEVTDCVFYNMGLNTGAFAGGPVFPLTKGELENAAGYENAGTAASARHLSFSGTYPNPIDVNMGSSYYRNITNGVMPIKALTRNTTPGNAGIAQDVYPITSVNPCVATAYETSARTAPDNGFYTPVSYKGAFGPTQNWLAGWTLAAKLGLVDTSMNDDGTLVGSTAMQIKPVLTFGTNAGAMYRIETRTTPTGSDWSPVAWVRGTGSDMTYVDPSGRSLAFFRVMKE